MAADKHIASIAVLPFANHSAAEDMVYFSEGMTEEIINALAGVDGLRVISRTSSFAFKDKELPLHTIAGRLQVSHIIEGGVRRSNDRLRISARLIDVEDDSHVWNARWDRSMDDIFAVQDEIALSIADELREQVGHLDIQDHLVRKQTHSTDAYTLALKGKFHFNRWNPESVKASIGLFEEALSIDPLHAESHLGLADAFGFMATTGFMPREESWKRAEKHIAKALSIHPDSASGYYQLANLDFFVSCDFSAAFNHIQHAVALNGNHPEALQFMAFLHMLRGDKAAADHFLQRALEVNPLSPETLFYKGYWHYRQAEWEEATKQFDALLEDNPQNIPALVTKLYTLLCSGREKEVLQFLDAMPQGMLLEDEEMGIRALATPITDTVSDDLIKRILQRADEDHSFQAHTYAYHICARQGRTDEAFARLEEGLKKKSSIFLLSFSDPLAGALKNDDRYSAYHQKIYALPHSGSQESPRSKPDLLGEAELKSMRQELENFMDEEQPFLNPDLHMRDLANRIGMHPNMLSKLINQAFEKNFNAFVNDYRIAYFKKLLAGKDSAQFSLIGLAYESGFNSKSVFNTYFKKTEGVTPGAYLRAVSGDK